MPKKMTKIEVFEEVSKLIKEAREESENVIRKLGDYGTDREIKDELRDVPSKLNWAIDLLYTYKNM